jgi:predicted HAD superfamily Cof-like phosphohydrolase
MTLVREFHLAFDQPAPDHPPLQIEDSMIRLRIKLIKEEYKEVMDELESLLKADNPDRVLEVLRLLLKELADLRYVVDGTAVSLGLPIDSAFAEVHASNMSKLGADGRPIRREDGKVLKGPNYRPADMTQFVPAIIEQE